MSDRLWYFLGAVAATAVFSTYSVYVGLSLQDCYILLAFGGVTGVFMAMVLCEE